MNHIRIITELGRNRDVFSNLLLNTPKEEFVWKPSDNKWCLLEVVCHLYDEEREDFRARVRHCLENPDGALEPIDPVGWVTARQYQEQSFEEKLQSFLRERTNSIAWLESLENPSWENTSVHPSLGKMSADSYLANWLAHDYIHIRQINRIKYGYLDKSTEESLHYAGTW